MDLSDVPLLAVSLQDFVVKAKSFASKRIWGHDSTKGGVIMFASPLLLIKGIESPFLMRKGD